MGIVVALDPLLLAWTPDTIQSGEFEPLLETLVAWSEQKRNKQHLQISFPSNTWQYLLDANCYPIPESAAAHSGQVLSLNDLRKLVNGLLSRSQNLERILGIEALAVDTLADDAPASVQNFHSALQIAYQEFIAACAFAAHKSERRATRLFIHIRSIAEETLKVSGSVSGLVKFFEAPEEELQIQFALIHVKRPSLLPEVFDAERLWTTSADDDDLCSALYIGIKKRMRRLSADLEVPEFYLGGDFLQSLKNNQCVGKGKFCGQALKACVDFFAAPPASVEPFTAGADGPQAQRPADGALAHRIHVTQSNEGLRLMLWRRPSGSWELANIGTKFELEIFSNDPSGALRSIAVAEVLESVGWG